MAFNSKQTRIFKATHSTKMQERLEQVQISIAAAEDAFKQTAEYYKRFAKINVDKKTVENYINTVFGYADVVNKGREEAFKKKQHETIQRLFETGRGSDIKGVRGTLWGLYNSVSEWTQHEMGKIDEKRLSSAWFGSGMDLNIRAFNAAKDLVVA